MPKISKLRVLQIERVFTILFFLTFAYFQRNSILDSFDRQIDLNVEKAIRLDKTKSNIKFYEIFAKKDKKDFSNKVDSLIVILLSFSIFFYRVQKRIGTQKDNAND